MFTLAQDGDREERVAWPLFLAEEFPQYEEFWRLFIVGLTGRVRDVNDIGFRPQKELDAEGRPTWHVEVAQLHYTTLLHLMRVFQLRRRRVGDRDSFLEAIVRLDAATDTACELLGRCLIVDHGASPSWDERKGRELRETWHRDEGCPFKSLHDYRNALVHGRVRPEHEMTVTTEAWATKVPFYTTFEAMPRALDWRDADVEDAAPADQLVDHEWGHVIGYCRLAWGDRLLPWARETFVAPEPPGASQAHTPHQPAALPHARSASADAPPASTGRSISFSESRAEGPMSDDRR